MRQGTKRTLITELLTGTNPLTREQAYAELRPMVEMQMAPMIFQANVGGRREPKPIALQLRELRYEINRVAAQLNIGGTALDLDREPVAIDEPVSEPVPTVEIPEEDEPVKPVASGKTKIADLKRHFLAEVRRIRRFCEQREAHGETLDEISVRPLKAGSRLLDKGIPVEALLSAMTLHWADDARRDAAIADFDFVKLSREIMETREIDSTGKHELFGYALTLVEARQPVMAIGPAGTGKSFVARQIADYLDLKYSEAPMTPGAQRGDLLGRHTISGFVPAEYCERFSGGGLFNLEEIDAADAGMLIVINNSIESDTLYNSINGEQYSKSADFALWSTANTFGLGANRQYTGREKLDAATLDRFRMGRFVMRVDSAVEESILGV